MFSIGTIFGTKNKTSLHETSVASLNPLISTHLLEARRSFKRGDYQNALLHCQEVIKLDPLNADAHRVRGVTKYKLDDRIGAATDFQHALKFP